MSSRRCAGGVASGDAQLVDSFMRGMDSGDLGASGAAARGTQ
jgi:hypothetical protein